MARPNGGDVQALRARAHELLRGSVPEPEPAPDEAARVHFSAFDDAQLRQAVALANRLWDEADRRGGAEGVAWVLDEVERLLAAGDPPSGLVKYALQLFMTHHPLGRMLGMPSLVELQPAAALARAEARSRALDAPEDLEAQMWFLREDELANEHHWHWHRVYPARRRTAGSFLPAERQSELFVYMHQQMLARYDTERLALGLEPVAPLDAYDQPIAEGYETTVAGYPSRAPGQRIAREDVEWLTARRSGVLAALGDPAMRDAAEPGRIAATNQIGHLVEATFTETDPAEAQGLHNSGHGAIAALSGGDGGVMRVTTQAIRDPVFWRWHRHIDNLAFDWQQTFEDGQDVDDGAADVEIAGTVFVLRRDIPGADDAGFDLGAWGEQQFGGERFGDAAGEPATDELTTKMVESSRTVDVRDPETGEVTRKQITESHLEHDEFAMFIRLANPRGRPADVTLRIFLAAAELAEQRRFWIELDKFHVPLEPLEKKVVARGGWESSVVRKPAIMSGESAPSLPDPGERNYCECGWPYPLLLPRGTREGMPFGLAVIATDSGRDTVVGHDRCGSQSFCGVRTRRYPDTRPMGYPFDLPFPRGVVATLAPRANVGMRELTIRWT